MDTGNPDGRPLHWSKCELMAAGPGCASGDGEVQRAGEDRVKRSGCLTKPISKLIIKPLL